MPTLFPIEIKVRIDGTKKWVDGEECHKKVFNYINYITCCVRCPNRSINQNYCYNGKPCFDCPSYNDGDVPTNEPPKDIKNMLHS